jgi:hypothetical protein
MHLDWEDDELMAMQKGGNRSFSDFMSAYDLVHADSKKKYNSIASHYYRRMLKGYIDGRPINDLPPTKNVGCLQHTESINYEDVLSLNGDCPSPINKGNSSIDLSRSSFSYKDKNYENKFNNTFLMNKSCNNISRYSINIEAQNDLNNITILLNDHKKKDTHRDLRTAPMSAMAYSDDEEMMDIDDGDFVSDIDKYSRCYESSKKHINFKQLPDVRNSRSQYVDNYYYDCQIEGVRDVPT